MEEFESSLSGEKAGQRFAIKPRSRFPPPRSRAFSLVSTNSKGTLQSFFPCRSIPPRARIVSTRFRSFPKQIKNGTRVNIEAVFRGGVEERVAIFAWPTISNETRIKKKKKNGMEKHTTFPPCDRVETFPPAVVKPFLPGGEGRERMMEN